MLQTGKIKEKHNQQLKAIEKGWVFNNTFEQRNLFHK